MRAQLRLVYVPRISTEGTLEHGVPRSQHLLWKSATAGNVFTMEMRNLASQGPPPTPAPDPAVKHVPACHRTHLTQGALPHLTLLCERIVQEQVLGDCPFGLF